MLGRQTLIVMVAGYAGLVMTGCGGSQPQAQQQPQCPAGTYYNGQYCQAANAMAPGNPATAPMTTPGAAPVQTQPPGATAPAPAAPAAPPMIATAAPAGPTATALDPTAAAAVTTMIGPLAQQYTVSGAKPIGSPLAGNFQQGQSLETQITMNPGKCYTVVGVGIPTIQNLDLQIVAAISIPGMAPPVAAADNTQGSTAVIGAKPNCYKWPLPIAGSMKLTMSVPAGQGMAAAQIYEK